MEGICIQEKIIKMDDNLNYIKTEIYDKCAFEILNLTLEPESKEYDACRFELSGRHVLSRSGKITPKKSGQFVTFWKRNGNGPIEPFAESDQIDFFIVNVRTENEYGQFVFPKNVLIKKGILSTKNKEGKRAFRVYPIWDIVKSKQAQQTQKWQLRYFFLLSNPIDLNKVLELYSME